MHDHVLSTKPLSDDHGYFLFAIYCEAECHSTGTDTLTPQASLLGTIVISQAHFTDEDTKVKHPYIQLK